jgi:hypothetical protein
VWPLKTAQWPADDIQNAPLLQVSPLQTNVDHGQDPERRRKIGETYSALDSPPLDILFKSWFFDPGHASMKFRFGTASGLQPLVVGVVWAGNTDTRRMLTHLTSRPKLIERLQIIEIKR